MADNLIFRIVFDLEKAVNETGQLWDKKYAKKLEDYMAKRPVRVKLDFEKLEDVKKRLAQLKIEPITPDTRASIKELARELQVLAKALEQVQKYSKNPTKGAVDASRVALNEEKAKAQAALAAQRAARAEANLAQARLRNARAANAGASATRDASKAYHEQSGYLQRLTQRMAAYWSVRQVGNFLTSVREVTAQFELQRVSLGAIIQDQTRANALFSEIKSFALKSPVSIMDLTKYTKQLAAYKIGVDELFETTKKLTDVSVGLGVSMDRVVLAYGQTRATGYLRASEIRQFTEMGVPIVEELAAKLSKMNGELVTAADVMDLVSKRGVSFELVKEVFDDMTSAGGIFYNMQEKQGNTLFGLWAKLGDAASVMYDEIGNTESVNSGMKAAIGLLTELMRNWKALANTAALVVVPSALTSMFARYALSSTRKQAADAAAAAATKAREAAQERLNAVTATGSRGDIAAANAALQKAKADEIAAKKATTNRGLLASGFKSIASSMATGLGIGLAVTAVTTLTYKLFEAYENATRLKDKLKEIDAERIVVTEQSVRNFEYLADAALKAVDGSKEQKDKLDELHRTFQNMIPVEDMSIENLRKLRSGADSASEGYKGLTESIREYIAQQQKQKALGAIEEEFGAKRITAMRNLYDWFDKQGLGVEERTRFFAEFEKQAQDSSKSLKEQIVAAFTEAGIEGGEKFADSIVKEKSFWAKAVDWLGASRPMEFGATTALLNWAEYGGVLPDKSYINDLADATRRYNESVSGTLSAFENMEGNVGKYTKALEEAEKHMADFIPQGFKSGTFAYQKEVDAEQIRTWGGVIVEALKAENVKIENEWFDIDKDKAFNLANIATINISAIKKALGTGHVDIQKLLDKIAQGYVNLVPKDAVVRRVRDKFEELARSLGVIDKVRGSIMGATERLEDYRKKINDTAKDYAQQVINLERNLSQTPKFFKGYGEIADKLDKAKELKEFFSLMAEFLGATSAQNGDRSDKRLETLKRISGAMREMYERYKDIEKSVGRSRATEFTGKVYKQELEYLNSLAEEFGIKLDVPHTIKELNKAQTEIYNAIVRLKPTEAQKRVLIDLGKTMDSDWMKAQTEAVDKRLKQLADRISRTKTAKEFHDKILGMTGDVELAANVSLQIYGSTGRDLKEQVKEQFAKAFEGLESDHADIMPKVNEIIDWGAYEELRDYISLLPKDQQKAAEDLVKAQQQMSVRQYEQWLKDLEKAKTYADKRIELARYTANNIADIEERIAKLNPQAADYKKQRKMLEKLIAEYKNREKKETAKLQYAAFKDTPTYVQMFEDLDNASTSALTRMRDRLIELKAQWQNLSPTELKELQSRLKEIDQQLAARNPFKSLATSYKKLFDMIKSGRTRGGDEKAADAAEKARQEAEKKMLADEATYQTLVKIAGAESLIAKLARKAADKSKEAYEAAEEQAEETSVIANEWTLIFKAIGEASEAIDGWQEKVNEAFDGIGKMMEAFGVSEEDMQFFDDVVESLNEITDAGQDAAEAVTMIMSGNYAEGILKGISAIGGLALGFSNLFHAGKVRKANKEIKRQSELLDQLEYTYGRLEKAADKLFGADYLNNYNRQIRNLEAQQAAYLKQAEAERSKGKKADKEKIKEYEDQARDTADAIKDLQDDLVAHFTGSSRADVARQMAKSWIEARASMSDTFAAIKEDYAEMIKNMIVEGAAARVIENALTPMWDSMEKMLDKNDVEGAIDALVNGMDSALTQANNGMEVLWKALEARGYDMKQLIGDVDSEYTGIAKNIAGATSEEINTAAAIGNTIMYHTSHLPVISQNVAAMYQLMLQGHGSAIPDSGATGWTDWQQQAMENYNAIARNTADTVVECRRAAVACEAATEKLNRALRTKGATSGFNVFLNS